MSSCFSRCLRVPIAIRAFYESYLWILQTLLLTHPDLHPGLLGKTKIWSKYDYDEVRVRESWSSFAGLAINLRLLSTSAPAPSARVDPSVSRGALAIGGFGRSRWRLR